MKRTLPLLAATLCVLLVACENGGVGGGGKPTLKTQLDSVSFAVGLSLGQRARTDSIDLDVDALAAGYRAGRLGKDTMLTDSQVQVVMSGFQQELMKREEARRTREGAANKSEAEKFLAEHKSQQGVQTMPNGLQYQILEAGTGATPDSNDQVAVLYKGELLDGTVFDSSMTRENPVTFQVNQVIPGWTAALLQMKEGAKWRIWIPPDLAYGENAPPGSKIKANSLLVFDVELLKVNPPAAPQEGMSPH